MPALDGGRENAPCSQLQHGMLGWLSSRSEGFRGTKIDQAVSFATTRSQCHAGRVHSAIRQDCIPNFLPFMQAQNIPAILASANTHQQSKPQSLVAQHDGSKCAMASAALCTAKGPDSSWIEFQEQHATSRRRQILWMRNHCAGVAVEASVTCAARPELGIAVENVCTMLLNDDWPSACESKLGEPFGPFDTLQPPF
jgi:hypothetical protein